MVEKKYNENVIMKITSISGELKKIHYQGNQCRELLHVSREIFI